MLSSQLRGRPCSPATVRTDVSHLQALATPPTDITNCLSHLSSPIPIDITKLVFYLQGHPDQRFVNNLLSGFFQGFRIGYSGPRAPKEYSNLPCANAGSHSWPFSPPSPTSHWGYSRKKKHSLEWRTIFHLSYPKHRPTSINAHVSPETYSLQYIKVDHAISILKELGQGCFMGNIKHIIILQF